MSEAAFDTYAAVQNLEGSGFDVIVSVGVAVIGVLLAELLNRLPAAG